jgi:threonine/homoserine/homoserine lactone efflux protein
MTLEAIIALAAAVFVFSLKPGPGIVTSMSHSMSYGGFGLVSFLVGFNVGLFIYLSIVFVGLMGIGYFDIDIVFLAILAKTCAALYFIVLGVKGLEIWNEETTLQMDKVEAPKRFLDIASSAVVLTLSNPMVIVFYAAIIPVFIAPELITLQVSALVMAMLMVIDSFGVVIYCAPILLFRKSIPASFMKYVKLASAIIIIMIGLYIGATALPSKDIVSLF